MKPVPTPSPRQSGMALVASLIILLLMTVIALSAMRGTSLFEKIAGNNREKQRAFQVAQTALLFGEWWINTSTSGTLTPEVCPTTGTFTALHVCATTLTGVPSTSQAVFNNWSPPNMSVVTGGGTVSSGVNAGDINYSQNPGIYIAIMPASVYGSSAPLYQVTAFGYGGSAGTNGTVAIVQSLYQVSTNGGINGATQSGILNTGE